jgi:decaprenyl-phosphate phosphoribosyltransferase
VLPTELESPQTPTSRKPRTPKVERGDWRTTLPGGLLRTARPKQWVKNLLVFAAPGAAGVLTNGTAVWRATLAFTIFCTVASGVYFMNDILDVEADRCHPTKRSRPVAAGVVSMNMARVVGATLLLVGSAASVVLGWRFASVVAIYIGVQFAYSFWLKREAILDLAAVASGFVIRAIAGGLAVGVPISQWFLIVATFGSLFLVTGKRFAEHATLGEERGSHRATLAAYTPSFLRFVLTLSSTVAIAAYCMWAFESQKATHGGISYQLSIVPFGLAMLRYAFLLDYGHGGAPEDVVLGDRTLQILGLIWVVIFALGVYG